jgi:hypothetical protein
MVLKDDMKESIVTRRSVAAGEVGTVRERLKADGTVEEVRVRFYPGQEGALQVTPYVLHKGERREDLLTYPEGVNRFLSGDDDYVIFPLSISFEYDDEIRIDYKNTSTFTYTLAIDVIVDYLGGQNRVV